MTEATKNTLWVVAGILFLIWIIPGCLDNNFEDTPYKKGDLSNSSGTPTLRYSETPIYPDDPYTTNDESNDQETGYYGTETVSACNGSSGNCYNLDADIYDDEVERLYFPKGGWVDIDYSECDDGCCYLEDENGDEWEIELYQ